MPKAYSYLRFSTPRQQWGDSARRQQQMAKEYAERHALELADEELADRGVSGYTGANMDDTSALGAFVAAVQSGHIERGSILLVEALDRLSRQAAWRASTLLGNLCLSGVTVVTLSDERVYSASELDRDPMALLFAVFSAMEAHRSSAEKARRLRATWAAKRARVASGETVLTSTCPAWLSFDKESRTFVVNETRAEVVCRIFRETLAGAGRHKIAQLLNGEGVPTFGLERKRPEDGSPRQPSKLWRPAYIATILRNPAAVGVLVPERSELVDGKRVRSKACDPVPDYFPAVVDEETWKRVQAMKDSARVAGRKTAHAVQRGRHANQPLVNPFAGLLRCSKCGATVLMVNHGINRLRGEKKYARKVVCERAKTGAGCKYTSVRLDKLVDALKHEGPGLAPMAPTGNEALDEEIAHHEAALLHMEVVLDNYTEQVAVGGGIFVREKLGKAEVKYAKARRELEALYDRRVGSGGPLVARKLADLEAALSAEEFDVVRVNTILRQCFVAAVLDTDARQLRLQWVHGGESSIVFDHGFPVEPKTAAKRRRKKDATA